MNRKFQTIIILLALAAASFPLTLEQAIDMALRDNSQVIIAEKEADAAREDKKSALTGFLPKLTLEASYTRLDEVPVLTMPEELSGFMPEEGIPMGDDDNYAITLGLQQPIFMGGKIYHGYKAAKAGAEAKMARANQQRAETAVAVSEAYYGVVKAHLFLINIQNARERMDAHLEQIEAMYEEGLLSRNDLLKTRVASSEIDLMMIQAENAVSASRLGLNFTLNLPQDTVLTLEPDTAAPDPELPDLEAGIEKALERRPDILAVEKGSEAADAGVKAAWGSLSPDIVGIFNYQYQRPNRQYEPEFYDSWNATVAASWDIFSWGDRIFQIRKARANRAGGEEALSMVARAAEMDVRLKYNQLKETGEALEVARVKLRQAREGYRVARAEFGAGMATNADVLDADADLIQAQSEYTTAAADYQVAGIKYRAAVGTSFEEK